MGNTARILNTVNVTGGGAELRADSLTWFVYNDDGEHVGDFKSSGPNTFRGTDRNGSTFERAVHANSSPWQGPEISKAQALQTVRDLAERIIRATAR